MQAIIHSILSSVGIAAQQIIVVHGGDINQSFCAAHKGGKVFIKLNSADKYPKMLQLEAEGLTALRQANCLQTPTVLGHGIWDNFQYLLLEWLAPKTAGTVYWEAFGNGLAKQHQLTFNHFGWTNNNFIGSLVQTNTYTINWIEFYANNRLMPLAKALMDQNAFSINDLQATEKFCMKLNDIIPIEKPSLLHGDLWSGNCMALANNVAAVFDPAVYYGHREMDIAMTMLFGGFDSSFYRAYENVYPLEKGWQARLPIMQLYPLLVHAVLFGGSYVERCKKIMQTFG